MLGALLLWRRQQKAQTPTFALNHPTPGQALITGASSGIGAAFARHLAAHGYHLVLVARREERLHALAQEISDAYQIQVTPLVADLACPSDVTRVEQHVMRLTDLDILINNAGFGTSGHFAEIDLDMQLDMIQVHINASVRLCRAALPGMIERQRGLLINVASIAAFLPAPGIVTYAASKNYLVTFSRALQAELVGTGVLVQALCPGFTYTEFHDTPEFATFQRSNVPAPLWMFADDVVNESLATLAHNRTVVVPGLKNRLLLLAVQRPFFSTLWAIMRGRWRGARSTSS
ncbi:MAG: SDR family oxidoreductase [Chloroflexaceae bacterium]|nr:SDR family oxidoreductase [Chloroflexaceae bacterium]